MSATEDIPVIVLRFIERNIDSVPHLEALLLLWEDPSRGWTQAEVSARIYADLEATGNILSSLAQRQLLKSESGDPPLFRYDRDWEGASTVMSQVAEAYRRQLVPIATFIHTRASASVREFARAFEIKKGR